MSQTAQFDNKKTARFANVDQVFNYTAEKLSDSENSLLLTPRQLRQDDDVLLSLRKSNQKQKSSNRKEHQQVDQKRKTLIEKREKFRKRLSQLPANMHNQGIQLQNQQTPDFHTGVLRNQHENRINKGQSQKMDIQQPKLSSQPEASKILMQKPKNGGENTNSAEEKTKIGFYSQFSQSSKQNETKLLIQQANQVSTQNLKAEDNQLPKVSLFQNHLKNRITMDRHSILKQLGVLFEQNEVRQKSSQESQPNNTKQKYFADKDSENLIAKAYRRLSQDGRRCSKIKKTSRVTLNFNEIQSALAQLQPNNAILIKSLKKEAEDRQMNKKNQSQKQDEQTRRSILQKYINQEQLRFRAAKENSEKLKNESQNLLSKIQKLNEVQSQLNEKIRIKQQESYKNDVKIDELSSTLYSPKEVSQLLQPIYYLKHLYAVNIVEILSRSKGTLHASKSYQIKFIIDELVFCKLISNEGEAKSLTFLPPTTFDKRINQWSIDIELRQTLLKKYNQKNLSNCEPIETVMKLGGFWQSLQKIQSDFQMLDQIFELLDLNLDEAKDQLSFKLQIKYNLYLDVRINFLLLQKQGYFSIRCEPQDSRMSVESKGHQQLLEFVTAYIEHFNL